MGNGPAHRPCWPLFEPDAQQHSPSTTPDLDRPAENNEYNRNESLRLTWQATPKNKVSFQYQYGHRDIPGYGYSLNRNTASPEAIDANRSIPSYLGQLGWNAP